jgi:phosphoglycolate phosphatase-like HAD superfamily hydrolase
MLKNYKVILWDFDGVIMDSNAVRDIGFEKVLANYPKESIEELMKFHHQNGGLSRYVKFRYFFEEILKQEIMEEKIQELANSFSVIMKSLLVNPQLLIEDSLNFIKSNFENYNMHIVSGSDQNELRFLCSEMNLSQYFKTIHGSPTAKKELVKQVIEENNYSKNDCVLIGDSINDYEAAINNGIEFAGYNNKLLNKYGNYIGNFNLITFG